MGTVFAYRKERRDSGGQKGIPRFIKPQKQCFKTIHNYVLFKSECRVLFLWSLRMIDVLTLYPR